MAKISTYPIISIPTLNDLLIGTDVENLNETKNFTIGDIADLIIVGSYVPYVGAIADVDLGIHSITASSFIVPGGLATQFVKADGSLDSTVYQPAGDYITGLSGEATALGPGVANVVLSNGAVIGKVLTGLTITGGSVSDTDTILQAFGKVQNQINSLVGGVQYQGTWNASTNTPTLQSGVGQKGYYYVVSVAGSTNLDGITDWNVGDWAIFDGTAWQQVDNTDTVVSVNGKVGVVVLTTTDIAEGTNLYYTDARVRQAISLTTTGNSGASTYDNLTGIFNIPNYTLSGLGGVPSTRQLTINGTAYDLSADRSWSVGTITQINTTGPLTGGPITTTGTIGITQSGVSSDGYLSSVDWNTFNNKQNALTNPVTGTGTTYYLPMWTGLTSLGDSIISLGTGVVNFNYNNPSGATVNYTNIGTTAYTYSIIMNNVTRNTFHSYTDGNIIQRINSIDVSKNLSTGQLVLPLYTSLASFTGTSVGYLGFDASGNILTIPAPSLAGYVPYVGATTNVDLGEFGLTAGQLTLDVSPTGTAVVGTTRWNNTIGSSETLLKGGSVILKNGVDLVARVVNKVFPNATLTKAAYQAVRVSGAQGQRLAVAYAQGNNDANSADTLGLVCETIPTNQEGFIITVGQLEGINTTGSLQGETWVDGDVLYLSPTTPGAITNIKPVAPEHLVVIGYVEYAHAINGSIYVKVMNGWELGELHDVNTIGAVAGQVLKYNGAIWTPSSDAGITGTGSPGQVAYFTGATTQAGSNNLFWDTANNRLGIGTNTPTAILDATISANAKLIFQNVSQNNLNVSGTNSTLVLNATGGSVFPSVIIQVAGTGYGQFQATTTETGIVSLSAIPITFKRGGTEQMRLTATGNLHIGTFASDSGQRLQVIGSARIGSTAATAMYWDDTTSRLGISTSSPQGKLDVAGSLGAFRVLDSGAEVYFTRDGNNDFFANAGTSSGLSIGGRSYLRFSTGAAGVTEVARFNSVGSLGIGTTSFTGYSLRVAKIITGALTSYGVSSDGQVQSDVTAQAFGFNSSLSTQAATFNLTILSHYRADQGPFGAGSTVETQYGFQVRANLIGATNNYGFHSAIPSGTGRWNLYMVGTADNYLAGNLSIGTTSTTDWLNIGASTTAKAHINLAAGVAPTTPVNGDIWMTSTDFIARINGTDYSLINSGISGSGAVGQVTYWSSASGLTGSNNLFWNNASSRLDITGSARIGTASAVAGATTIEQIYSGDNIIGSISARWGTGAMILGYGAKAKSGADGFVSTFDNFSARRAIFEVGQGIFSWLNTASVNTAKGSDLTPGTLMTLDATGNLLLGLISDAFIQANRTVIAINGVTDTLMSFRVSNTSAGYIYATSTVFDINSQSRPLTFSTTGTEKGRFFNNGNFGIGTLAVDTGEKLQVVGNTYISSGLRIGPNALTTQSIRASRNITGGTIITSALFDAAVQSDVTADVTYINAATRTAAASFNVSSIVLFSASQTVIGAGSSVTNQHGFVAASSLIGATNNYGFVGAIPSGTGRWNLYMSGTADNYIAGSVGIGTTSLVSKLNVAGIGGTDGVTLTLMNGGSVLNQNDPLGIVDFYSNDISVGAAGSRGNIAVRNEYPGHWDGNPIRENTYIALSVASSRVVYERMRISSSGAIRFNSYGVGAFTGTVAYNLAVDASGNIIETAGGVVDGSGTTNYVSKWSDPNTLTDSLIFDNGTSIGIGTAGPLYKLDVQGTSNTVAIRAASNTANDILFYATGTVTGQLNAFQTSINATGAVSASLLNGNSATGSAFLDINVTATSTGDPYLSLTTSGATNWSIGIDNSDSDKLKIGPVSNPSLAGANTIVLHTTGNTSLGSVSDSGQRLQVTGTGHFSSSVGIGTTSFTGFNLRVSKNITGAVGSYGISSEGAVQSDVTSQSVGVLSQVGTASAAFTLPILAQFAADQGTIGASSVITTQAGFRANASLIGATNNYAFWGQIPSGTGRWNLYMSGTANNYLAGGLGVGTATLTDNLYDQRMVITGIPAAGNGGGLFVTNNQATAGYNGFVAIANYRANDGTKTKPSLILNQNIVLGTGNNANFQNSIFGNLTTVEAANLTVTNTTSHINTLDQNHTSGAFVNYQAYLYVQRNTVTTNVNSYTGFLSRYQTAVGNETIANLYDFATATGSLSAGSLVTNRYAFYIDFNNTQVTNAWGIYQTSNTVKNYLNGNLLLGSIIDSGEKLQVNGTAKVTGISSFGGNMTLTTNTNYAFSIVNSGTGAASLNYSNASGAFYMGIDSVGGGAISGTTGYARLVWGQGAYPLLFATNNVERMRINESGSLGLGANTINASALFQMDSTSQGFLPPRMTATQRAAITTPAEGLIVYQTDSVIGLYIYANGTWRTLGMI